MHSAKKFTLVRVLCMVITALILISLLSCTKNGGVPDGIYSCVVADTGEVYTFSGTEVTVTLFIMGNVTEHHTGRYSVEEGIITMEFPTDPYGIYSGSFAFTLSEDGTTLTIGDDVFSLETVGETT